MKPPLRQISVLTILEKQFLKEFQILSKGKPKALFKLFAHINEFTFFEYQDNGCCETMLYAVKSTYETYIEKLTK